jgi:DNA polymerase type B, organellar and viral
MPRKKYSCDFETTTDPNDCRVWAYGYMEIGNKTNYKIGNSLEEFMDWCEKEQADCYFHNIRFDGEFVVNFLLKNGYSYSNKPKAKTFKTIISSMGQWYMIDICYGYKGKKKLHTVMYDSLKKLPFPVKKIAKDFKLTIEKGDIDYHTYRPIGHIITDEEYKYIKNDIEIIADALKIQFDQGLTKMTTGSDSLSGFKTMVTKRAFENFFPTFSLELDADLRKAYRGGFTWLNEKYAGKTLGRGIVFDVNSLYPSVMYEKPLPYGQPIFFQGEYEFDEEYPLYIQHIRCEFVVKKDKIPTIQIKKNLLFRQNEYLKSSGGEPVDLYVSSVDLELIREHYELYDLEFLSGWKFKQSVGLFRTFIDKWMHIKTHSEGAIKVGAKLQLNSLYGKFASSPDVTGKEPYLKEDGSTGFRLGDEEFKDPVYTPMGIFITSWARHITITTAQKCYDRIIYVDTDSLHLVGDTVPDAIKGIVDPDKLGFWKYEYTFERGKFIRQKTYVEEIIKKNKETGEDELHLEVKCAGMPDKVKEKVTLENFQVGFSSFGKLLPKHVSGGVVLVDTEFTIK